VVRVQNKRLFDDYQRERARICEDAEKVRVAGREVVRLEEHAPAWLAPKGFPSAIDSDSNEFWLWHGTSATIKLGDGTEHETWEILAKQGFDERVGGDSNGGLYGKGIYLADASSKANQYSTSPICSKPTNADGHHCMLLCRATMGSPFMATGPQQGIRRPPDNPALPGQPHDSVFAEEGVTDNGRGPGSQFHDEYVIFNGKQIYPEFVIWSDRRAIWPILRPAESLLLGVGTLCERKTERRRGCW